MPAPAATPLTAATIGMGRARRRMKAGLYQLSRSLLASPRASASRSRGGRSGSARLAPEQKARPAPVMSRQRAPLASSRSSASDMSSRSFWPKALRTPGSFKVITATPSAMSSKILPCFTWCSPRPASAEFAKEQARFPGDVPDGADGHGVAPPSSERGRLIGLLRRRGRLRRRRRARVPWGLFWRLFWGRLGGRRRRNRGCLGFGRFGGFFLGRGWLGWFEVHRVVGHDPRLVAADEQHLLADRQRHGILLGDAQQVAI